MNITKLFHKILGIESAYGRELGDPCNSAYTKSVRLRYGYFLAISVILILTIALGACLQLFFSVLVQQNGLTFTQAAVSLVLTPLIFFIVAVFCDEMFDLIFDALDKPPLVTARATFCTLAGLDKAKTHQAGIRVHIALICGLEFIPLLGALIGIWEHGEMDLKVIISGYILGGLVFTTVLAFFYVLAHIYVLRDRTTQDYMYDLRHALDAHERVAGFGDSVINPLPEFSTEEHDPLVKTPNRRKAAWYAGAAFLLLLVVATLVASAKIDCPTAVLIMAIAFTLISIAAKHAFPGMLGASFNVLMALFLVLALFLSVFSTTEVLDPSLRMDAPALFSGTVGADKTTEPKQIQEHRYPVCDMRWGHPSLPHKDRLNALDMAVFAIGVYHSYKDDIVSNIAASFVGTDVEVVLEELEDYNTIGRWGVFYLPKQKVRVLAIRGTRTKQDALYNLDMYATVRVMQFFDVLTPVLGILPVETIKDFAASVLIRAWFDQKPIYSRLLDKATQLVKESKANGIQMIVTGHSLGGVFAAIVSAKLGTPALAWSPPGQLFNQHRLGVTAKGLYQSLTVIKPDNDPVALVDKQQGFTQHILCAMGKRVCHKVEYSACEIYRNCGDPRNRVLTHHCFEQATD